MDWWEQTQPRAEPLHCAAPQQPEDILCPGSDDGLDDATKAAKRRRYEEQGRRYLRGKPLRLFSASLRGPFDKSSGWQNPWLPKNRSPLPASSLLRPTITKPAVKASIRRNIYKLEGEANSTPETGGSMQCHLPSPESNRDLQLDNYDGLDSDKRFRIQNWARNVTTGALEKDDFWAPAPAPVSAKLDNPDKPDNTNSKRPAGNDWLKSKLSKRSKSDHPSSSALMTPTPATPLEPIQDTSPPSFAVVSQEASDTSQQLTHPESKVIANPSDVAHGIAQLVKESPKAIAKISCPGSEQGQSPHSSTRDLNPMSLIPSDANIPEQLPASHHNYSEYSSELSSVGSSRFTPDPPIRPTRQTGDLPTLNIADTSQETIEEATASGDSYTEEVDADFESYLDQSFHYRTRPTRNDASRPIITEPTATIPLSQPTQTGTPVSENHQESVTFKAQQTSNDEIGTVFSSSESSSLISKGGPQAVTKSPSVALNEAAEDRQKRTLLQPTIILPSTVNADAVCKLSTEQDLRPNDLPINQDTTNINHPKPLAMMENILESRATSFNGYFSNAIVDGDTTLVADAMDMDGKLDNASFFRPPERLEMVKCATSAPSLASLAARASSIVDSRLSFAKPASADSPLSLDGEKRGMIDNASQRHEWDGEETAVHIPLSQMEWGVRDRETNSPAYSPSVALEIPQSLIGQTAENAAENPDRQMLDDRLQQELLAMEAQPATGDDVLYIKREPDEEVFALDVNNADLTDSSVVLDESALRPSQQSPWGSTNADTLVGVKNEFQTMNRSAPQPALGTSPNSTNPTSQLPSQHQSPWDSVEAQTAIRPYESITVASLLNDSPQWPQSQPHDTPSSLLRDGVSFGSFTTPQTARPREETPEPEVSIKSFAKFNTPSPQRRPRGYKHPRLSGSRLPSTQVLVAATDTNPWSTQGSRSTRHVSFAPLPCEEKDAADMTSTQAPRPASPPPAITPGADDDDTDCRFQKHFEAIKNRSGHYPPVGIQERLVPSESQQRLMSPEVGAMAEAFREADAFHHPSLLGSMTSSREHEETLPADDNQNGEPLIEAPQSPWREESQGLDAVAEVMQNLDDFLNPQWGEESELGTTF